MRAKGALAAFVMLAFTSPRMEVYAQQSSRPVHLNRLASLLDEDKAIFGVNVNFGGIGDAALDAITQGANEQIDLVMYDMEHSPFDVRSLRRTSASCCGPQLVARRSAAL